MSYFAAIPEWAQWISVVGSSIASLLLLFGRTYLDEKAKNLATKEDIAEITKTAESIKSQLDVAVQNRVSLDAEQRTAILDFYRKFHYWFGLCSDSTGGVENYEDQSEIDASLKRRMEAYRAMDLAYAQFRFFVLQSSLMDTGLRLVNSTVELQRLGDGYLYQTKNMALRYAVLYAPPITTETDRAHKDLTDQSNEQFDSHAQRVPPMIRETNEINNQFILLSRQILYG